MRRAREQDLATMTEREQPRQPVERRAKVVALARLGRATMECHAHAQRAGAVPAFLLQRPLRIKGGGECVGRPGEHRVDAVAGSLEDHSAVRADCLAQQAVMAGKRRPHRRVMLLPQLGAAHDIGEQERDCSARERLRFPRHSQRRICARPGSIGRLLQEACVGELRRDASQAL
jgi:hypothetical protein